MRRPALNRLDRLARGSAKTRCQGRTGEAADGWTEIDERIRAPTSAPQERREKSGESEAGRF
ncbi:hypothetical protein WS70_08470 [Burkholderia mayonis]|uniref:Uncharacterized protein n=1 Tax=Burkholderia mayonis TaxID=1385591 RepID=A0A1B4FDX8_9BURK|nr:hypothetical protein WS70_08470 [Burkholderia mayonis]KVE43105.1 hypothetical protein WS69_23845 [Burkholderia sp. BDU5]KVE47278.1 hypothetical protein WS70_25950 [Burkholderia mayonis]